ncbi:hypothetical protein BSU04_09045 [Caballeronia sordidicola]|uniref:Uncharacterized protein n=1 Tax=Caballeronia sordidicola TaxID=196367 RepID=A0A226X7E2_CABSO|nr:hypothetical protein BSU04_09045 [Caballeronia sordidicola]
MALISALHCPTLPGTLKTSLAKGGKLPLSVRALRECGRGPNTGNGV